jgi:hypothetical protein
MSKGVKEKFKRIPTLLEKYNKAEEKDPFKQGKRQRQKKSYRKKSYRKRSYRKKSYRKRSYHKRS